MHDYDRTEVEPWPGLRGVLTLFAILAIAGLVSECSKARGAWLEGQSWETETVCNVAPLPEECVGVVTPHAYRARWSLLPWEWVEPDYFEVPAPPFGQTWVQYDFPEPHPDLPPNVPLFFCFTAVNADGESSTEHGPIVAPVP